MSSSTFEGCMLEKNKFTNVISNSYNDVLISKDTKITTLTNK